MIAARVPDDRVVNWRAEYHAAADAFRRGVIDVDTLRMRLTRLGYYGQALAAEIQHVREGRQP